MMTDGPKYKRPTVDGYYRLANPSHIGEGYYDTKYYELKRFSSVSGGTIQNLFLTWSIGVVANIHPCHG